MTRAATPHSAGEASPTPPPSRPRRTGMRRAAAALFGLLALFGLYCLALGAIGPYFSRSALEHELSRTLGVPCSIRTLTVHPLTWKVLAADVAIPYPEGQPGLQGKDFLRFKRLEAAFSPVSLTNMTLIVTDLLLVEPRMEIVRYADGGFSPQCFFAPSDPDADGPEAATPPPARGEDDFFPLVVRNIAVRDGVLIFRDEASGAVHTATDVDLRAPFASTLAADRETALTPALTATINGAAISITGEAHPFAAKPHTHFTLRTHDFGLAAFREHLAPYTTLALEKGAVHTELTLRLDMAPGKPFAFSLAGSATVADLVLAGPDGPALTLPRGGLTLESTIFGPPTVTVTDLFLENPEVVARRKKNSALDWENFFPQPDMVPIASGDPARDVPEEPTASSTDEGGLGLPFLFTINAARLTGGKVTLHDAAGKTPETHTLENLAVVLSDVRVNDAAQADFTLSFGPDKPAFTAAGKIAATPWRINATVSAREVPFAPWSGHIAGALGVTPAAGHWSAGGDVTLTYGERLNVAVSRGAVSLDGVRLRDAKRAAAPLLDIGRLDVSGISLDLAARTARAGKITGENLAATFTRGADGGFALPAAPQAKAPAKRTAGSATPEPEPWRIAVDALDIRKSRLSLADASLTRAAALSLTGVTVTGSGFANHGNKRWSITAACKPGERGALSLAAKGTLAPLNLTFSGAVDKADLRPLSPYLREVSQLTLAEATLGGDFTGAVKRVPNSARGGEASIFGNLGLYGITLVHGKRELGGWGRLRAEKISFRAPAAGGRHLTIESITCNNPRLLAAFDKAGTSSIAKALEPPGARKRAPSGKSSGKPATKRAVPLTSLSIGSIALSQGQATYVDARVSPPYRLRVDNVAATMKNLSLDPKRAAPFTGSLLINGSPVTVSATLTALFTDPQGAGTANVRSLDLARFTQYAAKYLGHPVHQGELTADITASLKGKKLRMNNALLIRNLELGGKIASPHAPDMSLPAAVSLLRDINGDIRIDLPVSGTLGDPEFKLGSVVRRGIGNLAVKTVTMPFTIIGGIFTGIGSLFGESGPQQAEILFPPGGTRLDAYALNSLAELGKELGRYRSATLEITGMADREERDMLVDAWVDRSLRTMKYNALPPAEKARKTPDSVLVGPQHNATEYAELLFALYTSMRSGKQAGDPETASPQSTRAIMRILRTRAQIGEKELAALAAARGQAVRAAVIKANPAVASRVRVLQPVLADGAEGGGRLATLARIRVVR